jgi:hypothetical protein
MLDVTGLPVLDIAIGLSFFYFLLSIVASSVSEIVASIFRLRASNLATGIRALVGSPEKAAEFFADWRIKPLHTPSGRKPSYVLPRTAALAIVDTLAPNAADEARKLDPGQPANQDVLNKITTHIESDVENAEAKKWLLDAFGQARGDIDATRTHVEDRFNEVMDRATGWYKRKVQIILFVIALALAVGLNADTINVADRLSRDEALRAHVVAQAQTAGKSDTKTNPTAKDVETQIAAARASGLPLGWGGENIPNYSLLGAIGEKLAGFVLTAFALALGAPFWFDLLGKFARLRSTGNRVGTEKDDSLAPSDRDDRLKRALPV